MSENGCYVIYALEDPAVGAVVVATSPRSHFELALAHMQAGKHVLVEKPLADTSDDAARRVEEAGRRRQVRMVNHTVCFASRWRGGARR